MGQYMGHTKKSFFGKEAYPSKTCHVCNTPHADTWLHVLLKCKKITHTCVNNKRHNKILWEMWKLLISNTTSRYYTLMNAKTYNGLPRETIISTRLLRCTCDAQWCHCFARFKHEILCIIGLPYNPTHHKPLHRTSLYNS